MAKIFLTGATGYIGGETLHTLATGTTKHIISCLVRSHEAAEKISKVYPGTRIVEGDLDDVSLVEKEAAGSDVVLHLASTRHEPSSKAIIKGLSSKSKPGYWIQVSGASLFAVNEIKAGVFGEAGGKFYDNLKDIDEIRTWIKAAPSRVVDNLVLAQDSSKVKTALISGPEIYGRGRGPGNTRTIQAPDCAKFTLQQGQGFRLGAGKNVWSNVHVSDLAKLISLLVDAAANGKDGLWNDAGIYLPENGHKSFGEITALIAKEAHRQGFIKSPEVTLVIDPKDSEQITPHANIILGTNAKQIESKARKDLGWQPTGKKIEDDIPDVVRDEARALGLRSSL